MDGLLWFVLLLMPLVLFQRLLHREIQAVLFIIIRNPALTIGLFSMLFLPGVFLHEISHFIMAKFLGVRTSGFSIIPRALPDGRLQLGYVETARSDAVRDSLIGLAPLIAGGFFVAYAAIYRLELLPLWDVFQGAQSGSFWQGIFKIAQVDDFPLWFYLTFTVSSTMLPSTSDRHAFLTLALYAAVVTGLILLTGSGPWFVDHLALPMNNFLRSAGTMFGISAVVHIILLIPVSLSHVVLSGVTGLDIK